MVDSNSPRRRRSRAAKLATAIALLALVAAPAGVAADPGYNTASAPYVALALGVDGAVVPLVNSGEEIFGDMFEGIPDGIGAKPGPGNQGYVDLYVAHEQSHVPFGGFADFQDSSVQSCPRGHRLEVDHGPWDRGLPGSRPHPLLLRVHGRPGARLPEVHVPA